MRFTNFIFIFFSLSTWCSSFFAHWRFVFSIVRYVWYVFYVRLGRTSVFGLRTKKPKNFSKPKFLAALQTSRCLLGRSSSASQNRLPTCIIRYQPNDGDPQRQESRKAIPNGLHYWQLAPGLRLGLTARGWSPINPDQLHTMITSFAFTLFTLQCFHKTRTRLLHCQITPTNLAKYQHNAAFSVTVLRSKMTKFLCLCYFWAAQKTIHCSRCHLGILKLYLHICIYHLLFFSNFMYNFLILLHVYRLCTL